MKRLVDLYCTTCGNVLTDRYASGSIALYCRPCGTDQVFKIVCNGGTKNPRVTDLPNHDVDYYKDRIKYTGVSADQGGEPVQGLLEGDTIHERERFREDGKNEKRDKGWQGLKRKRGELPIYVDQKSNGKE